MRVSKGFTCSNWFCLHNNPLRRCCYLLYTHEVTHPVVWVTCPKMYSQYIEGVGFESGKSDSRLPKDFARHTNPHNILEQRWWEQGAGYESANSNFSSQYRPLPRKCLQDTGCYFLRLGRWSNPYKTVFFNNVTEWFINIVPHLRELKK